MSAVTEPSLNPRTALAALGVILAAGAALRVAELDQSLYGDELWSYVGATQPGPGAVLDYVRTDQEVTPPMFALLAWASVQLGDPAFFVRLPSIVASLALIPLTYLLAVRLLDRRIAVCAAALVALSPFLIWHSVEARAYALAIALALGSTIVLVEALRRGGRGWWVAYAALTCLAMYTHYTTAFVLGAQFLWALIYFPRRRTALVAATGAAAVLYLPWVPSLLDDLRAPTQDAMNALIPFTAKNTVDFTERLFGHPSMGLEAFLGTAGMALLAIGAALAVGGFVAARRSGRGWTASPEATLIAMLAAAAPLGALVASAVGTHMYIPRNISTSLPAIAIGVSALALAGPFLFRAASLGLIGIASVVGALNMSGDEARRPAFSQVASVIDESLGPDDAVLESFPFPLEAKPETPDGSRVSSLNVNYEEDHETYEVAQEDGPRMALRSAAGDHLAIAGPPLDVASTRSRLGLGEERTVSSEVYPGLFPVAVDIVRVPSRPDR